MRKLIWISGVVLVLILAGAVWFISPFGWDPLPDGAPVAVELHDPRYVTPAAEALAAVQAHRDTIPAAAFSVAVGHGGELVWAATVGWDDVEGEVPATLETRFRIGSTSKAVTATAFARLVQAGMVDPDQAIGEVMDLPNPDWAPITPRQLASHTAGIPGYSDNRDLAGLWATFCVCGTHDDVTSQLGLFDGTDLLFEPGTDFHYSSFDINLLSAVLEASADEPFLDLMGMQVWEPLGMTSLGADHPSRDTSFDATFYDLRGDLIREWPEVDLSQRWAGGGFLSTSSDLVLLGNAWLDDDFIGPETRELFWTPQAIADGTVNEQNYALGWRVGESQRVFGPERLVRVVHHGGVSKGAMSLLILAPDHDLVIAINTNTRTGEFTDFSNIWADVARIFIEFEESTEERLTP